MRFSALLCLLSAVGVYGGSHMVTVDANDELCFWEELAVEEVMAVNYQVTEGGFLDIDMEERDFSYSVVCIVDGEPCITVSRVMEHDSWVVVIQIRGPQNVVIHQIQRSTEESAAITANVAGRYQVCFSNQMSTMTPKELVFSINTKGLDEKPKNQVADEDRQHISFMADILMNKMHAVKEENMYMALREHSHRLINEATHHRVLYWAVFECVVVIAMSLGQAWYLMQFFEQKRMV